MKKTGRQNEPGPFKLKNQTSVPYLLQQKIVTLSCLVNSHSRLSSSLGYLLLVAASARSLYYSHIFLLNR